MGEVGGVFELVHVLAALLFGLSGAEAFFCEEGVVGVVEVHPDGEDLPHVLPPADSVLAQEGEGTVLHEVPREDGLRQQVQDHQFLDEFHEALLHGALQLVGQVKVVVSVLVVVAKPSVAYLPLDGQEFCHFGGTHQQRAFVGGLDGGAGDCGQVGQFACEYLLGEEPLRREVQSAGPVVTKVQVEQLAKPGEGGEVGDHASFLEGGVVAEVDPAHALREQSRQQRGGLVLAGDVVLLLHGVVALQEGPAPRQAAADEGDVWLAQADVLECLRLRVKVELALAGVVVVGDELGPLLQVGAFGLDEVGQVGRHHRDHVLHAHLVHQPRQEKTVLLLPLHARQQDVATRVKFLGLCPTTVVQFLEDQPVGDVEGVLAGGVGEWLLLIVRQVVEQVELDDICLLRVVDVLQLFPECGVEAFDVVVVFIQVLFELLVRCLRFCFRAGSFCGLLVALILLVVEGFLLDQLLVELFYDTLPLGRVVRLPHLLHLRLPTLPREQATNCVGQTTNSRSLSQHSYYNSGNNASQKPIPKLGYGRQDLSTQKGKV